MKKNTLSPSTINKPRITLTLAVLLVVDILTGNLPVVSILLILVVVTKPKWLRKVTEVIYAHEINAESRELEARMKSRRDEIENRAKQRLEKIYLGRKKKL